MTRRTDIRPAPAPRRGVAAVLLALIVAAIGTAPFLQAGTDRPGLLFRQVEEAASPAPPGAREPSLTARGGRLYMSWMEPSGDATRVMMAVRSQAGWSAPRLVHAAADLFVNWADFPGIAVFGDGTVAVHWLQRSGPSDYDYRIAIALSQDDGLTWGPTVVPHRDAVPAQHGFVSMLPQGPDRLTVVWLDGRRYGAGNEAGSASVDPGAMQLRATSLTRDGLLGPDEAVDLRTCSCCQTGLAALGDGSVLVAYRDRTEDEIRDISVARLTAGGWQDPVPVHRDGWEIAGCPVDGPAIAADGDGAAVAWFTAADGVPALKVAFSGDGGQSFGAPVRIDAGSPEGRADLVLLDDGTALVSWVEWRDGAERLLLCRVEAGAGCVARHEVATRSPAGSVNFPKMVRIGQDIFLAWTRTGAEGEGIAMRRASLATVE